MKIINDALVNNIKNMFKNFSINCFQLNSKEKNKFFNFLYCQVFIGTSPSQKYYRIFARNLFQKINRTVILMMLET